MKDKLLFLLVFILSLGAILPLFHQGFFPMHDDTQVARVFEMGKSLKDGMFPVRWVADLGYGYGYPIFNFYSPLAYYIGGFLTFFVDALIATKCATGISFLLSGLFMYFLGRKIFGQLGGLVSSILYVYAPYHAVDLYVRGDVAELWAYAFLPLIGLGFYNVYEQTNSNTGGKKFFWTIISGISFAGIIVSHNLTALMITPFLVVVSILLIISTRKKLLTANYLLVAVALGIGISAFYSLPVFFEMKYTNVLSQIGGGADFHDHFVCLPQLWQSPWGYGGSVKGCMDGLSFMIGKIHIILSVLSLFLVPFLWKKNKKIGWIAVICLLSFVLSIFLMLPESISVWEKISPMAFFQYPWRFLILASFFSSILGGLVFCSVSMIFDKKLVLIIGTVFVIGIVLFSLKYFVPQKSLFVTAEYYTNKQQLNWLTSKISDEYMPRNFKKPTSQDQIPTGIEAEGIKNSVIKSKTQEKIVQIDIQKETMARINLAYFPAWQASIDGKKAALLATSSGMSLFLPSGRHTVRLTFKQTSIEIIGNLLSVSSVFVLILGILYEKKRRV